MAIILGNAPDSWGVWFPHDTRQVPWSRFLDEVTNAGFHWIELGPYGYLPSDPAQLRDELEARNLKLTAGCVMSHLSGSQHWDETERQLNGVGTLLANLKTPYLVLIDDLYNSGLDGTPVKKATLDEPGWKDLIDTTHRAAQLARERYGLTTVFHPHTETHVEYEHQIERFLTDTDPDLVHLCFDVGHHAYRFGDPLAFYEKYQKRISYLHLKSVRADIRQESKDNNLAFSTAVAKGIFCEPDLGVVDFVMFSQLLKQFRYEGFAIIEQDMFPTDFDKPLPIARRSVAYYESIGLGCR